MPNQVHSLSFVDDRAARRRRHKRASEHTHTTELLFLSGHQREELLESFGRLTFRDLLEE